MLPILPKPNLVTYLAMASLAIVGCSPRNVYIPPPPPEVSVAQPQTKEVRDYLELTGSTRATEVVEIRARVGGYLKSIHFEDGAQVKQGDLLFVIEPEPFEVALAAAKASLQKAKASRELARTQLTRIEPLTQRQAVSIEDLDIAKANLETAEADVATAEAAISRAELDLSYTKVLAPISGQISRRMVDVGNLIAPQTNILTKIESYEPIFAYFTMSEADVLRLLEQRLRNGDTNPQATPIWLGFTDQDDFPYEGKFDFAEVGVDASTGTQLCRGIFANDANRLVPGLFVRIRLPIGKTEPRLVIDERAIAADQRGEYVLVVNDKNIVEYRPVKLGIRVGPARVIEQGVESGEWIVVNGLQRARPGAPVSPLAPDGKPIVAASAPEQGSEDHVSLGEKVTHDHKSGG